jgi:3-hydroxyacyl-CoA dehydrogenase/enoyl-CoA hydratase/3-hydroxybutyryl-CoA epimerase
MGFFKIHISDRIAAITLDDENAAVNTVSPAWIDAMIAAIEQLRDDTAVGGIVIASAKSGFMAGADLKFILEHASRMTPADALRFSQHATRMHRLLETCGKPVVAAMTGFALGGGYELALACTHRILADDTRAVVGLPEVNVGLLPGSGGTQRLPRMIGVAKAADALLTGKSYAPAEALELGLVDQVVPPAEVVAAAKAWLGTAPDPVRAWDKKGFAINEADGLLKQSTAGFFTFSTAKLRARFGDNYPAPIAILSSIFEGVQVPIDKGLLVESRYFAKLVTDPVSRNIISTTFVQKGLADKGARRPQGVPKFRVTKLGVLGAGMMGAGIAYVAAKSGIDVVLIDTSLDAAQKGLAYSQRIVAKGVENGTLSQQAAEDLVARIQPTTDCEALRGAELVIEAVFEDAALKADVTRMAQLVLDREAIFASNTSTLPITGLASAFDRPENFIGLHFFSPVDRMALVEVIMGKATSRATLARALDFVMQIRKTAIVVNDSRGFYTSRVFQTFIHEGMELLREGVAPALIENVARQAGMPVGPLAVTDEVTLALPMQIVRQSEAEDPSYLRPSSMDVMEKMVDELGRPGRKEGGGFYDYPDGEAKRLWPGLIEAFPLAAEQPTPTEVKMRLLYVQALETARCLEQGVLTHPEDADLGSVFGWGFPSWTGGTLSLIEMVGLPTFVAECDGLSQRHGARFAPTVQLREMAASGRGFDRV